MSLGRISSCGFYVGPTAKLGSPRTYVVVGAPRGGTSMCAGALRIAGVPMGVDIIDHNNEDRDFLAHRGDVAIFEEAEARAKYVALVKGLISTRSQSHEVWGWKDPVSSLYLDSVLGDLRNPHLIFVTRDIAAISMREWFALPRSNLSSASPYFYFDHLERSLSLYSRAVRIVKESGAPALILSYERSLRYPEDFAHRILAFTGMTEEDPAADQELASKIASYVRADAVSGRLSSTQRDDVLHRTIRNDLSFYGNLEDAYHACAELVNTGKYSDALTLSASILIAGVDGGRVAPQFVVAPQRFAVFEAGLCFIRAVAFANTADQVRALKEILKFQAVRGFLVKHGIEDPLVENLSDPVAQLQVSMEASMFGGPSTGS